MPYDLVFILALIAVLAWVWHWSMNRSDQRDLDYRQTHSMSEQVNLYHH